jgi:hypothetical protein
MFGNVFAQCEEKLPTNRYFTCTCPSIAGPKDLIILKGTSTYTAPPENTDVQTMLYMRNLYV